MRRHPAGFTLVELLVAATVTALIAASATLVLRGVTEADRRIESRARLATEARAAVNTIADALRNAHRPVGENERPMLEGIDDSIGGIPRDRLRFFTISRRPVRVGQPESDVREVEFGLFDPDDDSPAALVRRLDPTRNDEDEDGADGGGVLDRIATGLFAFDVTYHDGTEYREDWPQELGFPTAVRIELTFAPTPEHPAPLVVARTVAMAHGYRPTGHEARTPTANDTDAGGTGAGSGSGSPQRTGVER